MLLFTFMGVLGGFMMAHVYKVFAKEQQRLVTLLMAVLYPGIVFAVFFMLNLLVWHQGSSGAVQFMTLVALVVLWFGVSVPLVFVGAHIGFGRGPVDLPAKVSAIPRSIPTQGLM